MRVLMWHVHGSYTTALVQGRHEYLLPTVPDRGPDGRGRAVTWDWPPSAREVSREECADLAVDVVICQRPEELHGLAEQWLGGRRPGRDVPVVYLEHNAPQGRISELRHPAADRRDLTLVHVTHFNDLFWDAGSTRTRVVEHGIVDPGPRYSAGLASAAAVMNEPLRRGRVVGTDLLPRFASVAPVDLFGMGTADVDIPGVSPQDDVVQEDLHGALARRRVYLHPVRWTSLGLSLLEAMHLAMPVVALATTEVADVVPVEAGACSTDVDVLAKGLAALIADPDLAVACGKRARQVALARFGLQRFLTDWDRLFEEVVR